MRCVCFTLDPTGGNYRTPQDPLLVFREPLRGRGREGKGGEGRERGKGKAIEFPTSFFTT